MFKELLLQQCKNKNNISYWYKPKIVIYILDKYQSSDFTHLPGKPFQIRKWRRKGAFSPTNNLFKKRKTNKNC